MGVKKGNTTRDVGTRSHTYSVPFTSGPDHRLSGGVWESRSRGGPGVKQTHLTDHCRRYLYKGSVEAFSPAALEE